MITDAQLARKATILKTGCVTAAKRNLQVASIVITKQPVKRALTIGWKSTLKQNVVAVL
jgi:hypothetical protein